MNTSLSVHELSPAEISMIIQYWQHADTAYLEGMGVDLSKLPSEEDWQKMLSEQLEQPMDKKYSYCIIWLLNERPIGHCNVNKITFGKEAYMHLHIWYPEFRNQGFGVEFVKLSLPFFFENLQLKNLYSEPYALNESPHKTLEKCGFEFEKEYTAIPGSINFEQKVKRWKLTRKNFQKLYS